MLASGAFNLATACRRVAASLPAALEQVTPLDYQRPDQLPAGGVLVVGASATGLQLADELLRSGREVTLVGRRARAHAADLPGPRHHVVDGRSSAVSTSATTRSTTSCARAHVPSPQLVGTPDRADLDLNALTRRGSSSSAGSARP